MSAATATGPTAAGMPAGHTLEQALASFDRAALAALHKMNKIRIEWLRSPCADLAIDHELAEAQMNAALDLRWRVTHPPAPRTY